MKHFKQTPKKWLSLLLAVIMIAAVVPFSAFDTFAFTAKVGQKVDSAYGSAYVGYDGKYYSV